MEMLTEKALLVVAPEEPVEGALQARQRRSIRSENEHENHETNADKEEGGPRSVYFDQNQGIWKCRHCIWTYQIHFPSVEHIWDHEDNCNALFDVKTSLQLGLKKDIEAKDSNFSDQTNGINIRIVDQFVSENLQNGKVVLGAGELNGLSEFSVECEGQNTKKESVNKKSISHLHCETENGSTRLVTEIEVHSEVGPAEKSKSHVTEIDLERVLEEQDTHELYCPNCHSCITKRVILRKRKRIINEFKYEAKREKVDEAQHNLDVGSSLGVVTDEGHNREPEVFRCLSCFSFFIPKEGGFNIIHIFGKKEGNVVAQNSQQLPTKATYWSSFIETVMGKKKGNEIGAPLHAQSAISSGNQAEDSSKDTERTQTDSISESMTIADSAAGNKENPGILAKINDGGLPSPGDAHISCGVKIHYPEGETNKNIPSIPGSQPMVLGQSQSTGTADKLNGVPLKNDSGKIISIMSVGEQMEISNKGKPYSPSTSGPGTEVSGEAETVREDDDIGKPGKIISIMTVGEPVDISTKGKPYAPFTLVPRPQVPGKAEIMTTDDVVEGIESDAISKPISQVTHVNAITQNDRKIPVSVPPVVVRPHVDTRIFIGDQGIRQDPRHTELEILKSIVYGGLMESIASLAIVSSAAGSEASTLNIVALGLANLIGGLFVIIHDLFELRGDHHGVGDQKQEPSGRYWEQLGRKTNYRLHAIVALLSYIIFGLLPPVIYGFSFRRSDDKECKLIAVAAASLLCIALLAIGKAHVRLQKDYFKCLLYYIGLGVSSSGLAYVAGTLIHRFLAELGLFEPGADVPAPPSVGFIENGSKMPLWSSF